MKRILNNNLLYKFLKRLFSLVLLSFISFFIFGTKSSRAANDASFQLLAPSNAGTFTQGCIYTSDIRINTGSSISNAADIIIQYEPQKVDIIDGSSDISGVQILPGNAYDAYFGNIVDEAGGVIRLTGVSVSNYLQGESVFGRIRFKAKTGVTNTTFAIHFDGVNVTSDSNVAIAQTSLDALGSVNSLNLNFAPGNCSQDTSAPNITFISPQNGQSGVLTNTQIQLSVSDDLAGVDIAELEVLVNGIRYTHTHQDFSFSGQPNNYSITIRQDNKIFSNAPSVIYVKAADYSGNIKTSSIYINPPSVIITPTIPPPPTVIPTTGPVDLVPPYIEFLVPVSRQTISATEVIKFKITDTESGVSVNTLQVFVNDSKYVPTNTAMKLTPVEGGFLIEIADKFTYSSQSASTLFVTVLDNAGNNSTEKLVFNIPPEQVEQPIPPQTETKVVEVEKLIPAPLKDTYTNVEDGVDHIQKTIENVSPNPIRPVVKETGFLGLASLALLLPYGIWLISVLISFLAGGYFFPFLKLLFGRKKVYQPHSDVVDAESKLPVPWVRIKISLSNGKEFKKYVTNRAGRFYAHISPGEYKIEFSKRLYVPTVIERTFDEPVDLEEIFEITPLQIEDVSYRIQFGVLNFNAKKFIISIASILSFVNLVFTQSFTSMALLFIVLTAALYTIINKKKPQN